MMIRKWMATLLGTVLLFLSCTAVAETDDKQRIGKLNVFGNFTLVAVLPEGYELTSQVPEGYESMMIVAEMVSQDKNRPRFNLQISHIDWMEGRLNDASEEEMAEIEASFMEQADDVEVSYTETKYGTRVLLARLGDGSLGSVYTIYDSYEIEILMRPTGEASLNDEDFEALVQFLSELDFLENE